MIEILLAAATAVPSVFPENHCWARTFDEPAKVEAPVSALAQDLHNHCPYFFLTDDDIY